MVCSPPYKGSFPVLESKDSSKRLASRNISYLQSPLDLLFSCCFCLLAHPQTGQCTLLKTSDHIPNLSVIDFEYILQSSLHFTHCIYIESSTPKWRFPYLYPRFACLSNIISVLFPFKYPTKSDTLIFGGISTSI